MTGLYLIIVLIVGFYACILASTIIPSSSNFITAIILVIILFALTFIRLLYLIKTEGKNKKNIYNKILNSIFPVLYFCYIVSINYLDFGIENSEGILFLMFGKNKILGELLRLVFATLVWAGLILKIELRKIDNPKEDNQYKGNKFYSVLSIFMIALYLVLFSVNIVGILLGNFDVDNLYLLLYIPTVLYWIPFFILTVVRKIN